MVFAVLAVIAIALSFVTSGSQYGLSKLSDLKKDENKDDWALIRPVVTKVYNDNVVPAISYVGSVFSILEGLTALFAFMQVKKING